MAEKKDFYKNGFIYTEFKNGVNGIDISSASFQYKNKYPVTGTHNFTDWQDVTGLYELKRLGNFRAGQRRTTEVGDTNRSPENIIAIPLPPVKQDMEAEARETIEQYLNRRISELIQADNDFSKDRWDKSQPEFKRNIARDMSNQVTFARQELQAVLKHLTTTLN